MEGGPIIEVLEDGVYDNIMGKIKTISGKKYIKARLEMQGKP